MKERISSFIIACALVFSCVAIPFLTRPVPAQATGVEGMLSWEYMMHLWALEGLFTHDSANYYGGFQGYTDEQKSNAMSGLKDFYDGQTRDLKNWLVVGKGIAEAKVNDWWDNLKSGTLDLVGDVGSAVYDWLNSKSASTSQQWADYKDIPSFDTPLISAQISNAVSLTESFAKYKMKNSFQDVVNESDIKNAKVILISGTTSTYDENAFMCVYNGPATGSLDLNRLDASIYSVNNNSYYKTSEWCGPDYFSFSPYVNDANTYVFSNYTVKDKDKYKVPPSEEQLEQERKLPAVIDTYGGNLPQPYKKPDNDDKEKPVPYVPTPVPVDWTRIHGDGDGSGGVKIIIKDTDINSTKQFNYNEYKKLQVQIKKLSQTLNKILNLKQYNIENNTEIDGDGKTLPIMEPDFHQAIDLKKKFPFSLPWDVLYIFKLFNSSPEAPAVTIDYPVISKGSGWGGYTVTTKPIVVDFNTDTWNQVAKVCRVMLFLLFAVGICWAFFVK